MSSMFLQLSEDRRLKAIEECGARQHISPVIIEKDFWVCWVLSTLFRSSFADQLVFKGGTSLSKVFNAVDRFSEDIDLSLSPEFLGLPVPSPSRNQANKWMTRAEAACTDAVRDSIQPELVRLMERDLTAASVAFSGDEQLVFEIDRQSNSPVLLFYYPTMLPAGLDYLKRSVKLEFGSLTEQRPTGRHPVSPWLANTFPQAFPDWSCDVVALEIERTFWEKATILHAEFFRPEGKPTPDRFSRHYADTVALAKHPDGQRARRLGEVRAKVVDWKSRFFGSSWARYDLAVPGSFRLVPPESRVDALRQDYQAMRDMYLSEPLTFNELIRQLSELEAEINREATA
ncbi:nucleotidyl transferase AbiEii/AbiGii toxin family protein [Pirellulaceae bacterium SH449]